MERLLRLWLAPWTAGAWFDDEAVFRQFLARRHGLLERLRMALLVLAAAELGLVVLTTRRTARRLRRESERLQAAADQIRAGALAGPPFPRGQIRELDAALQAMQTLREQLAASLEAQWTAEAARAEQIAALTHDLKTPLTVIAGNAELLAESELPAEAAGNAAAILRAADRAGDYLPALRAAAAAPNPNAEAFAPVDAAAFLAERAAVGRALAAPRKVAFTLENRLPAGCAFPTQAERLGRALDNMLDNAARFTPAGADRVTVRAGAGRSLAALCREVCAQGLTGLEFAYGIPGTVGGAVYMNAGAYGGEIKGVIESAACLDEALRLTCLPAADLALGYRTSVFETRPWCILEASFTLTRDPGGPGAVSARMEDYMARRRAKQPLDLPSAGSTFKRPAGCFAGQLIDECGLRGFAVGGAAVSEKHCGFVVNKGGATCADVLRLTDEVRRIVLEKTGHTLEREIRVVQ